MTIFSIYMSQTFENSATHIRKKFYGLLVYNYVGKTREICINLRVQNESAWSHAVISIN